MGSSIGLLFVALSCFPFRGGCGNVWVFVDWSVNMVKGKGLKTLGNQPKTVRLSSDQELPFGVVLPPYVDRDKVLKAVDLSDTSLVLSFLVWFGGSMSALTLSIVFNSWLFVCLGLPLAVVVSVALGVGLGSRVRSALAPVKVGVSYWESTLNRLSDRIAVLGESHRDTVDPLWDEIMVLATSDVVDTDTAHDALTERVQVLTVLVESLESSAALLAAEIERASGAAEIERLEREHAAELARVEREFREAKAAEIVGGFGGDSVRHAEQLAAVVDSVWGELAVGSADGSVGVESVE